MSKRNPELVVFKSANLIDGTGAEPVSPVTVVVEGEHIKEVLSQAPGSLPQSAQVVDCQGRTLMPGLIDCHVHIICVEADLDELFRKTPSTVLIIRAQKILREALDQGFTSLRDCGGADAGFRLALEQGYIPGPRLAVSGRHLSMTGGHGDGRWPAEVHPPLDAPSGLNGIVADGVDACRLAARDQLRQGVDFLKVMAGGGCMSPSDKVESSQYSLDELKAVAWEAESAGTYVSAHCYSERSIINCLDSGVRSIEHGNLMTEKAALRLAESDGWLVPTLAAYEYLACEGPALGIPGELLQKIGEAREKSEHALALALKAGCIIGSGSDLLGVQNNKALELELQARVMGPMGAIVASTKTNAAIMGRGDELGTIEAGKLADMIMVDGDPLEDVAILQHYQDKISAVMKGGSFHKLT